MLLSSLRTGERYPAFASLLYRAFYCGKVSVLFLITLVIFQVTRCNIRLNLARYVLEINKL